MSVLAQIASWTPVRIIGNLAKKHNIQTRPFSANSDVMAMPDAHLAPWIDYISGAKLPIREGQPEEAKSAIVLAVNPAFATDDLAKIGDKDGYAVRVKGKHLYILGTKGKGVLNGVFRMLQKNTDIIWARANEEFGTVATQNPNLTFTQADYLDIPVFMMRGWQNEPQIEKCDMWHVRQCAGWNSHMTIKNTRRTDVFDDFFICFAAHNLIRIFLPEKEYFDQPPEYYPLVNGKRVLPASRGANLTQICYSNPDAKQEITKNLFKVVEQNPEYDIYGICQEDNMDKIMFERFCQTYKEATAHVDANYRHTVPVVAAPPSFDPFLKQAPWTLATPVTDLQTEFASSKPASEKTDVRVLADTKNLYLAGRFSDQFGFLSFASEYKPARDLWPAGNKVEICLSPNGQDIYQYVIDFNGNLCDLKNRNFSWDSKADLKVERDSDGWSAMLTIPLADLGATLDSPLSVSFIRYIKDPKNDSRGTVVWRCCVTDNTATFIPVDFKK